MIFILQMGNWQGKVISPAQGHTGSKGDLDPGILSTWTTLLTTILEAPQQRAVRKNSEKIRKFATFPPIPTLHIFSDDLAQLETDKRR